MYNLSESKLARDLRITDALDHRQRSALRNHKRNAKLYRAYPDTRLYYLRLALLANAERWCDWTTVDNLRTVLGLNQG